MIENKLKALEQKVNEIKSSCYCILQDIEDFEGYDELFIMENNFRSIQRDASEATSIVLKAYDELEEEK